MRVAGLALLLSLGALVSCSKKDIGELCEKESECEFACKIPLSPEASADRTVCTKDCAEDADCPGGSVCFGAECAIPCDQAEDCHEGSVCWEGGYCAVACQSDDDCSSGTCPTPGDVCM